MSYCKKCGQELSNEARFCQVCGEKVLNEDAESPVEEQSDSSELNDSTTNEYKEEQSIENIPYTENAAPTDATPDFAPIAPKKKFAINKKLLLIISSALVVLIIVGVIVLRTVSLNNYEEKIHSVYDLMISGAEVAERYSTLQSKVWRNCIYEDSSVETDKYTKNEYGSFFSDFNDALSKFKDGEETDYFTVSLNKGAVDMNMSELKDCPSQFEDEYMAIKALYIPYSKLTDLVLGSTAYSCNSFTDALNTAISDYKTELSSSKLLLE